MGMTDSCQELNKPILGSDFVPGASGNGIQHLHNGCLRRLLGFCLRQAAHLRLIGYAVRLTFLLLNKPRELG